MYVIHILVINFELMISYSNMVMNMNEEVKGYIHRTTDIILILQDYNTHNHIFASVYSLLTIIHLNSIYLQHINGVPQPTTSNNHI
jgi:hypothetical protein